MVTNYIIILMLMIPCTSQAMFKFLGLEHRTKDEITMDIAKAELVDDEYEKNEKLRSLYGEWHEAVTSQPDFNEKFALAIEELYLKHKNLAMQIQTKKAEIKKEKSAREKMCKDIEKTITTILQTKNDGEGLEEKETRLISLMPHLEKLKDLSVCNFEKFQNCEQQLVEIKKLVARRNILEKIELLETEKDLHGLISAYHVLLETYDTQRLRSSTQTLINELQKELHDNEQETLEATRCSLEYAALSAQIELLKFNTRKSDFSRKADLASLLERRAHVYKNQKEFKNWCDDDNYKARALWMQALALAPSNNAKQEIVKHLQ